MLHLNEWHWNRIGKGDYHGVLMCVQVFLVYKSVSSLSSKWPSYLSSNIIIGTLFCDTCKMLFFTFGKKGPRIRGGGGGGEIKCSFFIDVFPQCVNVFGRNYSQVSGSSRSQDRRSKVMEIYFQTSSLKRPRHEHCHWKLPVLNTDTNARSHSPMFNLTVSIKFSWELKAAYIKCLQNRQVFKCVPQTAFRMKWQENLECSLTLFDLLFVFFYRLWSPTSLLQ